MRALLECSVRSIARCHLASWLTTPMPGEDILFNVSYDCEGGLISCR